MAKNKKITMKIEKVEFPQRGRGTDERGRTVEVKGGIPGQEVEVRLTRRGKEKAKGKILEVLSPSPMEGESPCPHFGSCGGCAYQTLTGERELALKREQLEDLFREKGFPVSIPISRGSSLEGYRNKMEYTFGNREKDGPLTLGLHRKGHFHEILPTPGCQIVHRDFLLLQGGVQDYFRNTGHSFYHRMSHRGFLRHLVVRRSRHTGEILVNLVTTEEEKWDPEDFVSFLRKLPLEGTLESVYHTVNNALGDVIQSEKTLLLYGKEAITEHLLGLTFSIGPFSFFQTNTESAEVLYEKARNLLKGRHRRIFDLYSGTGTIAQVLAPMAEEVIGIEIIPEAVEAAKKTAKKNGLTNTRFLQGDVLALVGELKGEADTIVLDPPREGIHPKALPKILSYRPETILYISCNPRALAEELAQFRDAGYELSHLEALDQFPRTPHVETIALLSKEDVN